MILWDEKNPFENPFECDGEEAYMNLLCCLIKMKKGDKDTDILWKICRILILSSEEKQFVSNITFWISASKIFIFK